MFNVTEEKTVKYWFTIAHKNGDVLEISGDKDFMTAMVIERKFSACGSKDVAVELRKFADAILKIASKLEAIK